MDVMTDVLYGVCLPIIGIKRWSCKSARSISSENGNQAALRKAQLMASIVALWGRRSSRESEPQSTYPCERERSRHRRDSQE